MDVNMRNGKKTGAVLLNKIGHYSGISMCTNTTIAACGERNCFNTAQRLCASKRRSLHGWIQAYSPRMRLLHFY
jgi:hypothetical protein